MEKKEISKVSDSPTDSDTDSPPPVTGVSLAPPPPHVMNMNMAAQDSSINSTAAPQSIGTTNGGGSGGATGSGGGVDALGKKKRGRPRKYDSDGNLRVVKPLLPAADGGGGRGGLSSPEIFSFSSSSSKKGGGRPSGAGNWKLLASLGELFAKTAGGDFTPQVVTVNTGEDVAGKIVSFAEKGPRGICILSANGSVSNVTIRQPGSSGGILTYEGRFEILSLTGSFTVTGNGGAKSRTGGLSVSLASLDGRVIGGGIAGLLLAASPIQIVMGSFMPNGYKAHKRKHQQQQQHNINVTNSAGGGDVSNIKPDEQKGLQIPHLSESPLLLTHHHHHQSYLVTENPSCWNNGSSSDQKPSLDINVSVLNQEQQGVL